MVSFENPEMFWLIIPALIAGLYLLKKGTKKGLIISRIIVAILLITALASPFILVASVTSDDNPNIVIISDETESMEIFSNGSATDLYEALTAKTPTSIVRLTGDSTALGDAIIQYSTGDNQIVLVSDGNSNTGEDVETALQFAKEMGTTVYYVQPEVQYNDISVEIEGDKTVVRNNENQFNIIVTQAMDQEIKYTYSLYSDDTLISSRTITQTERTKTIPITQVKFSTLGAHTLRAEINPLSYDYDPINNEFYKAIYAIPKPKIRTIGLDVNSPLADILLNLYDVSRTGELANIDSRKAIIIDNTHANTFSESEVEEMKSFLNDGKGIVVVGGDSSYNFGDYLNSSIEEILPVRSEPTDWTGGRSIVLILDLSGSLGGGDVAVNESKSDMETHTISEVLSMANSIIDNEDLRDSDMAVVSFTDYVNDTSNGFVTLSNENDREKLMDTVSRLTAQLTDKSHLDDALSLAEEELNQKGGQSLVLIISDGGIGSDIYEDSVDIASRMHDNGVNFIFVHVYSTQNYQKDDDGNYYAELFISSIGQDTGYYHTEKDTFTVNIDFGTADEEQPDFEEDTDLGEFPLIELNSKHFITKNIDIEGSVTGYNDVTPKAGADRLIITSTGKPILTTWRYGLGRVAAVTTDNGLGGDNMWATELYSGNNSKLISSTVNWAIGNPVEESGAVVEAADTWYGTPTTIELTMYDEGIPTLKLDGETLDLSLTGTNVYEAVIEPEPIGMHDLSGYPVAVNYALEYRNMGLNEDMAALITANGGSIYTSVTEARSSIFEEAQDNSEKLVKESVSQKIYFLLAALIIFLGEVTIRRIKEIKEMKQQEKEIKPEI
ncbi:VWA domain-containing protein [Methanolobus sediminis]|uniref:VWA domain-containing protein n=1 Tax=Methanolobus sediminis TaxID=3072978 RepID=A0AA51YLD0_9EURY|nr:VWA domain-containing protein [Methanolobus sediminis]WMW24854.1 VWA domain-containing protein [Methanolobus sediminis]